jgi:thiol-disulfide isomerase/thioredoxin
MKILIVLLFALLPSLAASQELRLLPDVFLSSASKPAPPLRLLQGNPPQALDYSVSKPTLVHFWATWCAPCIEELPALAKSIGPIKAAGIDVVLVSVDAAAATKVPPFLAKAGIPNLQVYWDPRSELFKKFMVSVLPTTIALNARGEEIGRTTGAARWVGEPDAKFLASKMAR